MAELSGTGTKASFPIFTRQAGEDLSGHSDNASLFVGDLPPDFSNGCAALLLV